MRWLYVLSSSSTERLYFGTTSNLQKRVKSHQEDKNIATKNRGPWRLIYLEGYVSDDDAYDRERKLKQYGQAYSRLKRRLKHTFEAIDIVRG